MEIGVESGLRNIVEDLTPQLGGSLDVNGQSIVSIANGNVVIAPDGSGVVIITDAALQMGDDDPIELGAVQDYTIQWDGDDAVHTISAGDFQFTGGGIILDTTIDSNVGVIFKGANRFIHDFHHPTGDTTIPSGRNIFVGEGAGNFTMGSTATQTWHGSDNMGFGVDTLVNLTTGDSAVAIGYASQRYATNCTGNIAVGKESLTFNTIGDANVAIGMQSGKGVSEASNVSHNVFIGHQAGSSILTGGDNNVFIGYRTGQNVTTGSDNILIGYDLEPPAVDTDNHLNIGGTIYADLSAGNVGIGTATPTQPLSVQEKSCMTAIGGFAVKLTNKTGVNSVAGELVNAHTSVENAVELAAADDEIVIGAFLESGVADASEAWIVVGGIAQVKVDGSTTVAVGDWIKTSSNDAGRVESSGTEAPGVNHFREVGHALEGGGNNELIKIAMHFN